MRLPDTWTHRSRLDVKMTPMIDVVFLLLIFFVWTASFQVVERILPSEVSAAAGDVATDDLTPPPPEQDYDQVVVRIRSLAPGVTWEINRQTEADLDAVGARLRLIAEVKRDAPVILHPDAGVALGDVIDVYDLARQVGFEQVQFATRGELGS